MLITSIITTTIKLSLILLRRIEKQIPKLKMFLNAN